MCVGSVGSSIEERSDVKSLRHRSFISASIGLLYRVSSYAVWVLAALLCSSSSTIAQADSAPRRVSATLPLSGPAAAYGAAARAGFELAFREQPDLSTLISMDYYDSLLKPAEAVTSFAASLRKGIPLVHFDFGSATSLALAPIAETKRVVFISSAYDVSVSRGREYVMRFTNSTEDYVQVLINELRTRRLKKFVIVRAENPFFIEYSERFRSALKGDEHLEIISVPDSEQDFGALSVRLARLHSSYDGIGVFMFYEQSVALLRRIRPLVGSGYSVFGTDSLEEASSNPQTAAVLDGLIFSNSLVDPRFISHYRRQYGSSSHVTFAAETYDLARLLGEIVREGRLTSIESVAGALKIPKARQGALGLYHYKHSPEAGSYFASRIGIKRITKGDVVELTEVTR